jgi:hypothetical protein
MTQVVLNHSILRPTWIMIRFCRQISNVVRVLDHEIWELKWDSGHSLRHRMDASHLMSEQLSCEASHGTR